MIATDANVSRILIARQADSYLPGNIAAGEGGLGEQGGECQGGEDFLVLSPDCVLF